MTTCNIHLRKSRDCSRDWRKDSMSFTGRRRPSSTAPLQLASLIGFCCTLFGIGVLVYVVGRYFLEGSIPGFPFLASIIAIFSGAQLFALGVIGEYLARMHFRTMNRPVYVVRSVT